MDCKLILKKIIRNFIMFNIVNIFFYKFIKSILLLLNIFNKKLYLKYTYISFVNKLFKFSRIVRNFLKM